MSRQSIFLAIAKRGTYSTTICDHALHSTDRNQTNWCDLAETKQPFHSISTVKMRRGLQHFLSILILASCVYLMKKAVVSKNILKQLAKRQSTTRFFPLSPESDTLDHFFSSWNSHMVGKGSRFARTLIIPNPCIHTGFHPGVRKH